MAFWHRKKSNPIEDVSIFPNLPVIQGFGALAATYTDLRTREDFAKTFTTVSEVYSPIMYGGKAFSNMKVRLYSTDSRGEKKKEIKSHPLLLKLQKPNPIYDWRSLLLNYYVNKKVFGNGYVFHYVPTGFNSSENILDTSLWVLPSQYIFPAPVIRPLQNYYLSTDKNQFLSGYSFLTSYVTNSIANWKADQVLHLKEPNILLNSHVNNIYVELLEGRSPLYGLGEPITNIKKAYDAQNVILQKRGALGILSPSGSKDAVGMTQVLTAKDKKELQEQFQQYGLGQEQWQYIISNTSLQWQAMSVNIRDLMLFEGIENSVLAICNALNFPIILLNYLKGATYSNVEELKKSFYQDNIIPEGESFIAGLSNLLKLSDQKLFLEVDYSHIPCLQVDAKHEAEKDAQTVTTILQLQQAITNGSLTIEGAKAIMKIVLEFSEEDINQILNDKIIVPDNNNIIPTQNDTTAQVQQ
jgi:phage portal protein BeeE